MPIDRVAKANEWLAQTDKYDMRVYLDRGVLIIEDRSGDAPELHLAMAREISKYLPEVRNILTRRAQAETLAKFIGARVWNEDREGRLANVFDGRPSISVQLGFSNASSLVTADPSQLILLVEESGRQNTAQNVPAENAAAPAGDVKPDAAIERKKGLRQLLADSLLGKDK